MVNMDCTKIGADRLAENTQNLSSQIVCPSQIFVISMKKKLHCLWHIPIFKQSIVALVYFSPRMCHHWSKIDLTLMDFCIVHKCGLRCPNFVDLSSYTHTHIHTKKSPRNCISLQFLSFTSGFSIHDQIKFSFAFPRSARSENTVNSLYIYFKSTLLEPKLLFTLLVQFKLVYGTFGRSNMHSTLDFCPNTPAQTSF